MWRWRGNDVFVVEAGEGSPLLLVHAPALGGSSYEYRKLFPLLASRHRVIAFDLLGFGLSDKPRIDYSCELYVEQILAAQSELAGAPVTVLGSSLGAAYAIRAATRTQDLRAVVAIMPCGAARAVAPAAQIARMPIARAPIVGESLYNAFAGRRALHRMLAQEVYGDAENAFGEVVDAYYSVAHQPGARHAVAALVGGRLDCDVARDLPFLDAPLLLVWGKRSKANPARNAAEYAELAKRSQVAYFARSALVPHDEEAAAVAERIEQFVS